MTSTDAVLAQFSSFTEDQKYNLIMKLMQETGVQQLRKIYSALKEMLSLDFVPYLPHEVTEKIFTYLDVSSLCSAARCSHSWRELTDNDKLWYHLCKQMNYMKYESLPLPQENNRPTSPRHKSHPYSPEAPSPLPSMCKWKKVFMYSLLLSFHWKKGIYSVAPLLHGHKRPVTSVAYNGDLLVSGSGDNTARVWSVTSLDCLLVLEGHSDSVNCVAITDGLIGTGCADSLVRIFELRTGQCIHKLQGHAKSIDHIAMDGRTVVSASSDCTIKVWDVITGKCNHTLTGHTDEVECIHYCSGLLLSASWDRTIRVWDVSNGMCQNILQGHTEVVYCCQLVNGKIVSGGGDGLVKVWDSQTGLLYATLTGHKEEVLCLKCSTEVIVSGSADSTIRVWNFSGFCIHILEGHIGIVRCLHLEGNRLVSGGDRKRIVVWDTQSGSMLHTVHRQKILLHRMCITDTKIITASPDSPGTISIINYW